MPSLLDDLLSQQDVEFDPIEAERQRYFREFQRQQQTMRDTYAPLEKFELSFSDSPTAQPTQTPEQPGQQITPPAEGLAPEAGGTPPTSQPTPEEPGSLSQAPTFAGEAFKATIGGVYSEIRDIVTNIDKLTGEGLSALGFVDESAKQGILNLQSILPDVGENQTAAGKLVRGLVEVGTGFILFGAVGKAAGITSKVLLTALEGTAEAGLGSKPTDETLSNALVDFAPSLKDTPILGSVVQYLQTNETDSTAERVLKSALENILLDAGLKTAGKIASTFVENFGTVKSVLGNERGAIGGGGQLIEGSTNADLLALADKGLAQQGFSLGTRQPGQLGVTEGLVDEGLSGANLSSQLSRGSQIESTLRTSTEHGELARATLEKIADNPNVADDVKRSLEQKLISIPNSTLIDTAVKEGVVSDDSLRLALGDSSNFTQKRDVLLQVITDNATKIKDAADAKVSGDEFLQILRQAQQERNATIEALATTLGQPLAYSDNLDLLLQGTKDGKAPIDELMNYARQPGFATQAATGDIAQTGNPYINALVTIYKQGLLSGPPTLSRVTLSQTLNLGYELGVKYAAGIVTLNPQLIHENNALVHGYLKGISEGFGLLYQKITVGGTPFADAIANLKTVSESAYHVDPLSAQAFQGTHLGNVVDQLGIHGMMHTLAKTISLPGTILSSVDDFFRLATERAFTHRDALIAAEKAVVEGGVTGAAKDALYKDTYLRLLDNPLADTLQNAKVFGDRVAFSKQFGGEGATQFEESLGQFVKFANSHPLWKVLIPFANPVANVFNATLENLPGIGLLMESQRRLLAQGGVARAEVLGRQALASSILGIGAYASHMGLLNGAGPSDKAERDVWLAEGHQPYSINIPLGDGKVSQIEFKRFGEPISILMGLAADIPHMTAEAYREYEKNGDVSKFQFVQQAVGALTLATSANLKDKFILSGLSGVLGALNNPEREGEKFLEQTLSGMIPFSGLVRNVNKALDPTIVETQDLFDGLKKNFSYFNEELPRKRNLFGDPVTYTAGYSDQDYSAEFSFGRTVWNAFAPFKVRVVDENHPEAQIFRAFAESNITPRGLNLQNPTYKGVELTEKEQETLAIARGTMKLGGKDLKQALFEFVSSPTWQQLTPGDEGLRSAYVDAIINRYTKAARAYLGTSSDHAVDINERYQKQLALNNGRPLF